MREQRSLISILFAKAWQTFNVLHDKHMVSCLPPIDSGK